MLELKDFFHLSQLDELLEQLAADEPGLVVVAGLDPRPTEYAADAALADLYERTKRGLGVPWMGVVAMAFAHYRNFYDCLWQAMEPAVATQAFADACKELRIVAEQVRSTYI